MAELILEAKKCKKCPKPRCVEGCPVRTSIPQIIELFLENKIMEAGEILFNNNPLSVMCSLICPHEKNCLGHCILSKINSPVKFFEIENYISSFYLEKLKSESIVENGFSVGIIGAGPAGLTLAIILRRKGFHVTIIDSRDKIGGVLRYGIPSFRLPKDNLDTFLVKMYEMGIQFRPNTLIGPVITLDDMIADGYDAIFIGTGTWRPNKLSIPGETLGHVHYAIDYLKNPESYRLGKEVVIIGAGNVAMDVARTILRTSDAKVTITHHRGEQHISATKHEYEMTLIDGAQVLHYLNAEKITREQVIFHSITETNIGEEIIYHEQVDTISLKATSVIIAIGQGALSNIVKNTNSLNTSKRGLISTSERGVTTREGVFAAGDVVTGSRTVVEAVAYTKQVAEEIEQYCFSKRKNK